MYNQNITPYFSDFTVDGAYDSGTRMKMSGTFGILTAAGDEACLGTLLQRTLASGDRCTLVDIRAPGSRGWVAGGAIAVSDRFTSAAAGKVVTGTGGAEDYGYALTASTASGGTFEGTVDISK